MTDSCAKREQNPHYGLYNGLSDFFRVLLKNPLGDLPNEVLVVLGSSDKEPFDLLVRCARAFFREAPPQLLGVSVVSHDHALLPRPRRTRRRCGGRTRPFSIFALSVRPD